MTTPANPDDLLAFLRAALDEDERAARAWLPLGNPTAAERDHIARHDPARVLAEVDAKRRILDWHTTPHTVVDGFCVEEGGPCTHAGEAACTACGQEPCHTVRLLALPFADRPGFREEWRP